MRVLCELCEFTLKRLALEQDDTDVAVLNQALRKCVTLRAISLAHNRLGAGGAVALVDALLQLQQAQAAWCAQRELERHDDSNAANETNLRLVALDLTAAFESNAAMGECHAALMCLLHGQSPESGLQYLRLGRNSGLSDGADGQRLVEAGMAVSCTVMLDGDGSRKASADGQKAVGCSDNIRSVCIEREKKAAASF